MPDPVRSNDLIRHCMDDGPGECMVLEMGRLAESLMSTLAAVLDLYKVHTASHPEDEVRILTIGHAEAQIMKARQAIYG